MKDFSETIAACDLKVGRCTQLIEIMKVCMSIESQGHFFTIYFPGFVCFVLYLCVISSLRYWIFGDNFCLLEGRKKKFLSASRSQFVLSRPAKILKIGQQIKFLWPK